MSHEDYRIRELPSEMWKQEQEIFARWRDRQIPFASDGHFVEDGIVHFPTYERTSPKLLFLLKEPNDKKRNKWNLAEWLGKGAYRTETSGYKSWEVVARWVHDITEADTHALPWNELERRIGQNSINERSAEFRKIAVVNMKKSGGGGNTNMSLLYPEIEQTKSLILDQIRLYKPTIVVCGGTFGVYRSRIASENDTPRNTRRGVSWYFSESVGIPIVDYPHYSYYPHLSPAIKPAMHYGLVDAVREILDLRKK
ncbi:MAG: hypothetical protein PHI18_06105 [bacterium]|nr:hypothetical protein [bacterium]